MKDREGPSLFNYLFGLFSKLGQVKTKEGVRQSYSVTLYLISSCFNLIFDEV